MNRLLLFLEGVILMSASTAFNGVAGHEFFVYVGTYTGPKSKGIYLCRFDASTGKLSAPELAAEVVNPSFLAIHPNQRFLYAVGEMSTFDDKLKVAPKATKCGVVSAFAIAPETGKLSLLNQASSGGAGPCHLVVDKTGRYVLVANYTGGSVAALSILDDGRVGEATAFVQHTGSSVDPKRQKGPHAHSINLDPANRFAFAADLGLDKVLIYRFDPTKGSLTANDPPFASVHPGAGPRHFAFHTSGQFAYVINEMGNTVTAFRYDAGRGALTEIQTLSTLPPDYKEVSYTSEVQVHPSGKFLYGSNRGHDSIVVFAICSDGRLSLVEIQSTRGKWPRHFGIDPTGAWLLCANQNSDNIVVFRIDRETGRLTPTGQVVEVPAGVCVKFLPVR